jgi:hypothetical protein
MVVDDNCEFNFEAIKMDDCKMCNFDKLSPTMPPLPEIFPDAAHNFLADGLNFESLDNVISFHKRKCNAESLNGPCNHDDKTDVDTLYSPPGKYPRRAECTDDSCIGSCNHDNITDASFDSDYLDDEDDHGPSDHLDDEDDSMEPVPVTVSKPASETMIAELKEKCINTIHDNLATFPASLRGDFIERARTAVIGERFFWCQGLCDYYMKSLMSGETLEGVDRSKCPSAQFNDQILVRIAHTLATGIMFCDFRGECKRKPDGKNCMDPTPEEAIKIVEVIIAFARLADALRGAVVLQICGGKQASKIMLPKLKKRMKSSGVGIIILNENSFHMSFYGYINPRVFFMKDLQQYLVYKDFHQLYLTLAEALEQLKTMGILDLTITLSQMLEWAQPLAGIKDHSNTPAETTNAYDAEYTKRCVFRGANFARSKRLKWLENRLVNLNVDLELARNEASHKRVTALEIEIDEMKADKIVLETQTAEQRVATYALKRAEKEAEDEAQRAAKAAERNPKRAEKEAEEEAQRVEKAAQRDAKWSAEVDASIERCSMVVFPSRRLHRNWAMAYQQMTSATGGMII